MAEVKRGDLSPLIGKTVASATYNENPNGYPYVRLDFTDGFAILITEEGQAGDINVSIEGG